MDKNKVEVTMKDVQLINIQGVYRLTGKVYGHPRFDDGTEVTTSTVLTVETRNTLYKLEDES